MGRPRIIDQRKAMNIYLHSGQFEKISKLAKELQTSPSSIIRILIDKADDTWLKDSLNGNSSALKALLLETPLGIRTTS